VAFPRSARVPRLTPPSATNLPIRDQTSRMGHVLGGCMPHRRFAVVGSAQAGACALIVVALLACSAQVSQATPPSIAVFG